MGLKRRAVVSVEVCPGVKVGSLTILILDNEARMRGGGRRDRSGDMLFGTRTLYRDYSCKWL